MSAPTPAAKTERLLNLVICLLYTRQPLSKQRIRAAVPQYGEAASDEAFDRMFERDKDELRDLGIPLRAEAIDPLFDDETGYRLVQATLDMARGLGLADTLSDDSARRALVVDTWSAQLVAAFGSAPADPPDAD